MGMDAIYVHGLGSGAATSTLSDVRKYLPQFIWHAVEVNEDPEDSVRIINEAIRQYDTRCVLGTSLGGLYLMYADVVDRERHPIHRIICNPACNIADIIRSRIGFGTKEYFVPRQDGVQEYALDEAVCQRFEKFIESHTPTVNRYAFFHPDVAVFSINDELIGEHGVLQNMEECFMAGFEIMVEGKGGHRLGKEVLKLIQSRIFSESKLKAANAVLYGEIRRIPGTYFYTFRGEEGIGVTDMDGKVLVPAEMDEIGEMMDTDGVIALRKGDRWGCIDWRQTYVAPVYDKIDIRSEEMVKVLKDGQWGWLTWEGKFTTDHGQADIGSFADADK